MDTINLNPPEEAVDARNLCALIDRWLLAISVDSKTHRSYRDRMRYLDETGVTTGPMWKVGFWSELTGQGVYQVVKRAVARAGLDDHIQGPHDLRRAFATILGKMHPNNPMRADMIRRQLGHAHYSQTADYTLLDADDIRLDSPLKQSEVTHGT